jgi:hypothetical protein
MRKLIRFVGLALARFVGTKIRDIETGELIGRALLLSWRGRIHVIGLKAAVRPMFIPQKRLTYWKQEIGFTVHPPPDFPKIADDSLGSEADQ